MQNCNRSGKRRQKGYKKSKKKKKLGTVEGKKEIYAYLIITYNILCCQADRQAGGMGLADVQDVCGAATRMNKAFLTHKCFVICRGRNEEMS